jgi:galactokinase
MSLHSRVSSEFHACFRVQPRFIVRAPGRLNLIGEHTDYNDGYVLPMAIDRAAWMAVRPRADRQVRIYSLDFDEYTEFSLDCLQPGSTHWSEYLKGVAWALQEAGYQLQGWEGVLAGDIPIGAGLSSSAALEMATARAFGCVSGFPWDTLAIAQIGQRAENEWIGTKCGIMDQMTAVAGIADQALLIDCRSLAIQSVPLPPETVVVALDTTTRRSLVDSEYNDRVAQCEAAAAYFGESSLRNVSMEQLESEEKRLECILYRRARHVITENERTKLTAAAMRRGDTEETGRLMDASHASLRDDYDVSSQELNAIVDVARRQPGCYGAKLSGAGFGGCAVALVASTAVDRFVEVATAEYQTITGLHAIIYKCMATNGAEISEGRTDGTDYLSP